MCRGLRQPAPQSPQAVRVALVPPELAFPAPQTEQTLAPLAL